MPPNSTSQVVLDLGNGSFARGIITDDSPLQAAAGGVAIETPARHSRGPWQYLRRWRARRAAGQSGHRRDASHAGATHRDRRGSDRALGGDGLTAEQDAYLHNVTFSISDMSGMYLGSAVPGQITIDGDAAGYGWFVDATPGDDAEFGNGSGTLLYTYGSQLPAGHIDLLTTVMHELGHQLGLGDSYDTADRADLMFGQITTGERRLPDSMRRITAVAGTIDPKSSPLARSPSARCRPASR